MKGKLKTSKQSKTFDLTIHYSNTTKSISIDGGKIAKLLLYHPKHKKLGHIDGGIVKKICQ